jgi:hypothetical protein
MTLTITTTLSTGQVLSSTENPFVIGTTGAILTTQSGWSLFAPAGTQWSVWNFGAISATGTIVKEAVYLTSGTFVNGGSRAQYGMTNFSATVLSNTIGIEIAGPNASAKNFGTITGNTGIVLLNGGLIVNGGSSHPAAVIDGSGNAVRILGGFGAIQNLGTINGGSGGGSGILLDFGSLGGSIQNQGRIVGAYGVKAYTSGTITNSGNISGDSIGIFQWSGGITENLGQITGGEIGVDLAHGGTLINGATFNPTALISSTMAGFGVTAGVSAASGGLIINYGSMSGIAGVYMNGTSGNSGIM